MSNIRELAMRVREEMRDAGYTEASYLGFYADALLPIVRFHEERGTDLFDQDILADYIRMVNQRKAGGKIGKGQRQHLLYAAEKMSCVFHTGKLVWKFPQKVMKHESNDYYTKLFTEYEGSSELHPNTRGDVNWVARSFFSWLTKEGYPTLDDVDAAVIQRYVVHCSGQMTSVSMYNVLLYLRKLCAYLAGCGLLDNDYHALLSMRVSRESKMYPAAPQKEILLVLERIDRSTTMGKRDYAVILLGAITGLRAVDVRNMRLSDIDWAHGEIRIVQSKTGNTNMLPLTEDVGEAVKDYILHARPDTPDDRVFIRMIPPFVALYDSWSIGDIWDRYRRRAGLPRDAFDGKGFHSLRRALGKNMVTAGIEVTTAAQVLGDELVDSAKKYIALDSEHLAECALDFAGIAWKGGGVS
jgi:integrase